MTGCHIAGLIPCRKPEHMGTLLLRRIETTRATTYCTRHLTMHVYADGSHRTSCPEGESRRLVQKASPEGESRSRTVRRYYSNSKQWHYSKLALIGSCRPISTPLLHHLTPPCALPKAQQAPQTLPMGARHYC